MYIYICVCVSECVHACMYVCVCMCLYVKLLNMNISGIRRKTCSVFYSFFQVYTIRE